MNPAVANHVRTLTDAVTRADAALVKQLLQERMRNKATSADVMSAVAQKAEAVLQLLLDSVEPCVLATVVTVQVVHAAVEVGNTDVQAAARMLRILLARLAPMAINNVVTADNLKHARMFRDLIVYNILREAGLQPNTESPNQRLRFLPHGHLN
jgi:hypothetical protein